jgi:hypothetical protein
MAWPELRGVGLILASLLRTWPLEWISLCTTVSSWPVLFPELQNGLDLGPKSQGLQFPLPHLDPEVDTGMFDPEKNNRGRSLIKPKVTSLQSLVFLSAN